MRASRFDPAAGARRLGSVDEDDMAKVEEALRARPSGCRPHFRTPGLPESGHDA